MRIVSSSLPHLYPSHEYASRPLCHPRHLLQSTPSFSFPFLTNLRHGTPIIFLSASLGLTLGYDFRPLDLLQLFMDVLVLFGRRIPCVRITIQSIGVPGVVSIV